MKIYKLDEAVAACQLDNIILSDDGYTVIKSVPEKFDENKRYYIVDDFELNTCIIQRIEYKSIVNLIYGNPLKRIVENYKKAKYIYIKDLIEDLKEFNIEEVFLQDYNVINNKYKLNKIENLSYLEKSPILKIREDNLNLYIMYVTQFDWLSGRRNKTTFLPLNDLIAIYQNPLFDDIFLIKKFIMDLTTEIEISFYIFTSIRCIVNDEDLRYIKIIGEKE